MPCLTSKAGTACWRVEGMATTQLPLRILGLLAQRDRLFTACEAEVRGGLLSMTLTADRITIADAELIADKMRVIVGVAGVALDWTSQPAV
jgi:hypothetical protein